MELLPYGSGPDQAGDLYLPRDPLAPLVCLFHGGFWRMPYGRDQLDALATRLSADGFAVWNLGYRRVGPDGHPWPATLLDTKAALAALPRLQLSYPQLDLRRLSIVGHSAGGHLAFWAATVAQEVAGVTPIAAIGLAPLLDLEAAYKTNLGGNAVELFLGGSPDAVPERYHQASPRRLLPLRIPQFILHGEADTVVPPRYSRAYAKAAFEAGDTITYNVIRGADHMSLIDPTSVAYTLLSRCLRAAA